MYPTHFNPRSREGSDVHAAFLIAQQGEISIHAPAKGATQSMILSIADAVISIHAPAKGATPRLRRACKHPLNSFQSTLPRRERLILHAVLPEHRAISIHAPAKGATGYARPYWIPLQDFNPRSREGSDVQSPAQQSVNQANFNPRSREGSDISNSCCFQGNGHFNPRSREGSDLNKGWKPILLVLFQSTLPRRERQQKSPRLFPMIFTK